MQNNNKIIKKTGIIALLFLFFSIYMVYYTNPALLVKQENQVSNNLNQNASYGKVFNEYVEPGPPPKRASQNIPQNQKVYIAIIDSEYRPSNHHCLMRQAWIDDAEKLEFVDGVEIYSNVSFSNSQCQINSISFPPPPSKFHLQHNPSCVIIRNMLRLFLERSDAGWLLYLTDNSFVNVKNLPNLISSMNCNYPLEIPKVSGQCIEMRDYFQIFQKNSGSLISRKAAILLTSNKMNKTWDVSCEIEIDFSEAIAHALDINSLYAIRNNNQLFLGSPFSNKADYKALLDKSFSHIEACPDHYESSRVCHPTVQPFRNLAVWSGVGEYMDKYEFMKNAKEMIESATNYLSFKYNIYKSDLCMSEFLLSIN